MLSMLLGGILRQSPVETKHAPRAAAQDDDAVFMAAVPRVQFLTLFPFAAMRRVLHIKNFPNQRHEFKFFRLGKDCPLTC